MRTTIIVDSASDITNPSPDTMVLPMTITFGDETFLDGVNLSHEMFYKKLVRGPFLPVTSQITPYEFDVALDKVLSQGKNALIITMSSKLSGTYQNALIAAEKYPGFVSVVDSKNISVGEKILTQYAENLREENPSATADELAERLNEKVDDIRLFAMLDSLEFLKRGGRISKTAALAGTILSIKPLIEIQNGLVVVLDRARGTRQGGIILSNLVENYIDEKLPIALGYSGTSSIILTKFLESHGEIFGDRPELSQFGSIGGTIGTHAGPGVVAVAFFGNENMRNKKAEQERNKKQKEENI